MNDQAVKNTNSRVDESPSHGPVITVFRFIFHEAFHEEEITSHWCSLTLWIDFDIVYRRHQALRYQDKKKPILLEIAICRVNDNVARYSDVC